MKSLIQISLASLVLWGNAMADNMCTVILSANLPKSRNMISNEEHTELLAQDQLSAIINLPHIISSGVLGFQNSWKLSVSANIISQNSQLMLQLREQQRSYQISIGKESLLALYVRADVLQAYKRDTAERLQRDIDAVFGFGRNEPLLLYDHSNGWSKMYIELSFVTKSIAYGAERNITRSISLGGGFQGKLCSFDHEEDILSLGPLFDLIDQKAISHIEKLNFYITSSISPLSELPALRLGARVDFTLSRAWFKEKSSDTYSFAENSIFDNNGEVLGENYTVRGGLYLSVGGF